MASSRAFRVLVAVDMAGRVMPQALSNLMARLVPRPSGRESWGEEESRQTEHCFFVSSAQIDRQVERLEWWQQIATESCGDPGQNERAEFHDPGRHLDADQPARLHGRPDLRPGGDASLCAGARECP